MKVEFTEVIKKSVFHSLNVSVLTWQDDDSILQMQFEKPDEDMFIDINVDEAIKMRDALNLFIGNKTFEQRVEMTKEAYTKLIEEDLQVLNKNIPDESLELDHIKLVLCSSIDFLYPETNKV